MTDEQTQALRERLDAMMWPWIQRFALDRWDITIGITEAEALDSTGGPHNGTAADCIAEWEYERAQIRFDGPYAMSIDDRELERHVIHELLHCVMDEAGIKNIKHEEHVVLTLTRAYQAMSEVA